MASLVEKYQGLLKKLLPPGRAWENVKEHEILKAIATETKPIKASLVQNQYSRFRFVN